MTKTTILIDMDSTINEFDDHFVVWAKSMGYGFDWSAFTTWHMEKAITGCENHKHQKAVFAKVLNEPKFWLGIPVTPEAQDAMSELCANEAYDIKICTNPWGDKPLYKQVKLDWLSTHFPFIPHSDVVFSGTEKWKVPGRVIIDDKPEVLEKCRPDKITVKSNRPYNKDVEAHYDFSRWSTVPGILQEALGKWGH